MYKMSSPIYILDIKYVNSYYHGVQFLYYYYYYYLYYTKQILHIDRTIWITVYWLRSYLSIVLVPLSCPLFFHTLGIADLWYLSVNDLSTAYRHLFLILFPFLSFSPCVIKEHFYTTTLLTLLSIILSLSLRYPHSTL